MNWHIVKNVLIANEWRFQNTCGDTCLFAVCGWVCGSECKYVREKKSVIEIVCACHTISNQVEWKPNHFSKHINDQVRSLFSACRPVWGGGTLGSGWHMKTEKVSWGHWKCISLWPENTADMWTQAHLCFKMDAYRFDKLVTDHN